MLSHLQQKYRKRLWKVYARAVALISVLGVTLAVMIGGFDLVKVVHPTTTLNSALHEKYKSNESYTEYGTFKKSLSDEQITRERTLNYAKLLRMERRNGGQRLLKVGLALAVMALLNLILVRSGRRCFYDHDAT